MTMLGEKVRVSIVLLCMIGTRCTPMCPNDEEVCDNGFSDGPRMLQAHSAKAQVSEANHGLKMIMQRIEAIKTNGSQDMLPRNPISALLASKLQMVAASGPDNHVHGLIIKLIDDQLWNLTKMTFNTSQENVDNAVSDLHSASASVNESFTIADSDYSAWKTCIGQEKSMVKAFEAALSAETSALEDKTTACNSAVGVAQPTFPAFSCDFADDECDLSGYLDNLKLKVEEAKEEYALLNGVCMEKTAIFQTARATTISSEQDFLEKHAECLTKLGTAHTHLCMYSGNLKQKCSKYSTYTQTAQTSNSTDAYLQSDWKDILLVRCMLTEIQTNDTVDEVDPATISTCQTRIGENNSYATEVGEFDEKKTEVADYMKYSKDLSALGATSHDCSQDTFNLGLGTWSYPKGLFTPTDSTTYWVDYIEDSSGSLTLDATSGMFGFCDVGCTVPNITTGVQAWTTGCEVGQEVEHGTNCEITAEVGFTCTSPSHCNHGQWANSGRCRKDLLAGGADCTAGADCTSGVCTGGACATPVPTLAPTPNPTPNPTPAPTLAPTAQPTEAGLSANGWQTWGYWYNAGDLKYVKGEITSQNGMLQIPPGHTTVYTSCKLSVPYEVWVEVRRPATTSGYRVFQLEVVDDVQFVENDSQQQSWWGQKHTTAMAAGAVGQGNIGGLRSQNWIDQVGWGHKETVYPLDKKATFPNLAEFFWAGISNDGSTLKHYWSDNVHDPPQTRENLVAAGPTHEYTIPSGTAALKDGFIWLTNYADTTATVRNFIISSAAC